MNPLVSVFIPSYNHGIYIQETLKSLLQQDYSNMELIIIDDGSSDDSVNKIEQMKELLTERFGKIIFKVQENKGICYTFNRGLELATGKYFYILSSDDIITKTFISKQIAYLEENDDISCSYTNGYHIHNIYLNKQKFEKGIKFSERLRFKKGDLRSYMLENVLEMPTTSFVYKRAMLNELGGYDENITFEDADMHLRISKNYKIGYINEFLAYHRLHSSNSGRNAALLIEGIQLMESKYNDSDYSSSEKARLMGYFKDAKKRIWEDSQFRYFLNKDVLRIICRNKKLVGWGTGSLAADFIHQNPEFDFTYFIDSSNEKSTFTDRNVFDPKILLEEDKKDILVVILSSYYGEISEWLEAHSFKKEVHYY